jgi:site-specific DNA recombinase
MESTNGHGFKKVILYARVSTAEQAKSGYSLAQQLEALRQYATSEGFEVVEEVEDAGWSGASLERPGMDRVRDLVEAGSVSVVLAQDRDRFAREPAYHYLLKKEFEEYGCKLRALNDHKDDDSAEGELMNGVLDQLAKFERAKMAERTRRGLLCKAREGKVIKGPKPNFGFRFNETNDQLVIYEPEMRIVEKIFRMAADGMGPKAIQTRLYQEGIPSPAGKAMWPHRVLKFQIILNDLYKPHSYEEVAALVLAEVAARLDPSKNYGIWWYNRRNVKKKQASEPDGSGGRRYKARTSTTTRDKGDWIAVPVPASLPHKLVNQARFLTSSRKGYERKYEAREWQLKGLMRCSCGQNMQTWTAHGGKYSYYRCKRATRNGSDACPQKAVRVERVEPLVWDFVSDLLTDPERIRVGMEQLIEQERATRNDDLTDETEVWAEKIAECDRLRSAYQDQQAAGLMTMEELSSKLMELEDMRKTAKRELAALETHRQQVEELEKDRDALLKSMSGLVPEALNDCASEEKNRLYRILRLEVTPCGEGYKVSGAFCISEPTPLGE